MIDHLRVTPYTWYYQFKIKFLRRNGLVRVVALLST